MMSQEQETADPRWKCPNCGAAAHGCGRKGAKPRNIRADDMDHKPGSCEGLLCECEDDGADPTHGVEFSNPCYDAVCYHCGWGGEMPPRPKKIKPWEKSALDNGWSPPAGWAEAHEKLKPGKATDVRDAHSGWKKVIKQIPNESGKK